MADYDFSRDSRQLAENYEVVSAAFQFRTGTKLIETLQLRPGDHVLDVGCGTGQLAEYVADAVGSDGHVQGIDPLPARIAIAARRARPNLTFEIGDAYALDGYATASFDAIYLNAVFHWLPEKSEPLAAFHRLLKPGGRLGLWTISGEHPSTIRVIKERLFANAVYGTLVRPEQSGPQPLSQQQLHVALEAAGFRDLEIELISSEHYFPSADDVIDFIEASSFGNFLHRLPEPLRAGAAERIRVELERDRTDKGIALAGKSLRAIATK